MTTKVQSSFTPISWYPTPRTQQQSGGRGNCHSLSFHYLIEWRHNMMIKFRVSVSSCFCNKDHKRNGLKQHTFIMYFIVLWVMTGFSLDKTQEVYGAVFLLEMLGGALFLCLFQLLPTSHDPWLEAHFLHLQSQQWWAKSSSHSGLP